MSGDWPGAPRQRIIDTFPMPVRVARHHGWNAVAKFA